MYIFDESLVVANVTLTTVTLSCITERSAGLPALPSEITMAFEPGRVPADFKSGGKVRVRLDVS